MSENKDLIMNLVINAWVSHYFSIFLKNLIISYYDNMVYKCIEVVYVICNKNYVERFCK